MFLRHIFAYASLLSQRFLQQSTEHVMQMHIEFQQNLQQFKYVADNMRRENKHHHSCKSHINTECMSSADKKSHEELLNRHDTSMETRYPQEIFTNSQFEGVYELLTDVKSGDSCINIFFFRLFAECTRPWMEHALASSG
jgi:hypothetical protein